MSSADLIAGPGVIEVGEFVDMDLPDSCEWELLNGTVVSLTFPDFRHSLLQRRIYELLATGLRNSSVHIELPYMLSNLRAHRADVAVVSREAERRVSRIFPSPPELIVEVLSESNRRRLYKLEELEARCLDQGTLQFWRVDPLTRTIEVRDSSGKRTLYGKNDAILVELAGDSALIPVGEVFEDL
ncbi:MAG: Uma2 family endonuclease [Bryobacteraceae bacterium]|nr:Uma2 family endonuclease [Bryobacteraceae bacterium]